MSLNRLVLRCLAVAAIQQNTDEATAPTMADERVFDSLLDPLVLRAGETKNIPCAVVYTDDDEGAQINTGSTGVGPMRRHVDLRVEISIGSLDTTAEQDGVFYGVPVTDAQLEAQLDLFEQQVKWALFSTPDRPYSDAFSRFVVAVESIQSFATRDESGNNRFSARRMHFRCRINDDCPPAFAILPPGARPPAPAALDLSQFPGSGWLGDAITALYNTPSFKPVINALAGTGNPYAFLPAFKRFSMNAELVDQTSTTQTFGPNGVIATSKLVEIP